MSANDSTAARSVPGENTSGRGIRDDRRPSWGLGRIVMVLFWLFGLLTAVPALVALIRATDTPIGPRLIAVLAGLVYLVIAVGITHNGRKMRFIAWAATTVALVGSLITGLFELGTDHAAAVTSAWSRFGADYWYVPLVLPLIGFVWLWRSDPRRIVELAEGIERPKRFPWHNG